MLYVKLLFWYVESVVKLSVVEFEVELEAAVGC